MEKELQQIEELRNAGGRSAQVLIQMGLLLQGKENPELVQAASALCGGLHNGGTCGALTGAALMLGAFGCRHTPAMVSDLQAWFEETYGSALCRDISGEHKESQCARIVQNCYSKARQQLVRYGWDMDCMASCHLA